VDPIEMLLEWATRHPGWLAILVFVVVTVLRGLAKAGARDVAQRSGGGRPPVRPQNVELEEAVRRNFEEMMRRRAAAQRPAARPPTPAAAATRTPPTVPNRTPLRPPTRSNAPAPRPIPPPPPPPRAPPPGPPPPRRPPPRPTPMVAKRRGLVDPRASKVPSLARRQLRDRESARRALLLREILDVPLALRDPSSLPGER
jgi:hypothetical protein